MAQYKITSVTSKSADWKIIAVTAEDGYPTDPVSVNRTDRNGRAFPNFDSLAVGMTIEANLWKSPTGKWSAFPPDAPQTRNFASGGTKSGNMTKVMEQKQEGIKMAQENKENGIKTSSTIRMAVDIAIAENDQDSTMAESIIRWRKWLLENWDITTPF